MKKLSFRRRNSILGGLPLLGPGVLGALGVILLLITLRVFLPGVLTATTAPLWKAGSALSAGAGNTTGFFEDRNTLMAERTRLEAENVALTNENATLNARVHDLEQLLGSRTEAGSAILAGVLAHPPVSPYDVLIVDAGTQEGIHEGKRAFGPGGIPLGTVSNVADHSAHVSLYSAPGRETDAWIGDTRIPVTLVGEGSGAFYADVSRDAGIQEGWMVFVSGPGALPIGTVVSVSNDPSSPRSRVQIKPITNPFSITWMTVSP